LEDIRHGYVAVGRVLGAWGIRGDLKVEPLAPESAFAVGHRILVAGRDYTIERSQRMAPFVRLKLNGMDTREEAQILRGAYLEAAETDLVALPEGQYYRFQLIGLNVRSLDGSNLGSIVEVLSTPENDVYVVNGPDGELLIPAVEDVIRDINLAEGAITIEIIPGLLP
jgi:16S rRNA processing protein RimM